MCQLNHDAILSPEKKHKKKNRDTVLDKTGKGKGGEGDELSQGKFHRKRRGLGSQSRGDKGKGREGKGKERKGRGL